ncbi:MAG: hypothetical protein C0459_08505 [Chitinophaga sp.]|nr:hypothetical protein [Chitinophaga sp.]
MSHFKERKEKDCLNCNAIVEGRYCHVCGQENIEPKESFWHLVTHFVYDIIHFDGKFFSTLKFLLFKPAFISKEYIKGRRMSYLHPIRMYVFTSAIFFLVLFTVNKKVEQHKEKQAAENKVQQKTDTSLHASKKDTAHLKDTSTRYTYKRKAPMNGVKIETGGDEDKIVDIRINDEDLKTADPTTKSFLKGVKKIAENKEDIEHMIPKVMFITLPLVALSLMLLYRRRKDLYYVDHLIVIIHLFIFIYIALGVGKGFEYAGLYFGKSFFITLREIISLLIFFYTYKTLRNFYKQGRFKSFIKCCLLYCCFGIIFAIIYALFVTPILF